MQGTRNGGVWTRTGRGSCEIWSLHLGDLIRAEAVRGIDFPPTWAASMNSVDLGRHPTRDAAMQRIEAAIVGQMQPALGDWIKFQVDPKRPKR